MKPFFWHATRMQLLRWSREHWFPLGLCLVFILPWIAFWHALQLDFAPIDDGFLIVYNPIVHGFDWQHLKLAFTTFDPELYIPVTLMSFQLDWLIGHGSAVVFHVTNILLHGANAVLVAILLSMLLKPWDKAKVAAIAAAAIFAVHPLNTEAAVWAAGRKDLLSAFFFLLSFISYLRFVETPHWGVSTPLIFLSITLFILALLSKVLVATLPAVLVLDLLLRKKETTKKDWLTLIPFFALAVVFLYVATFGKSQVLGSSTLMQTFAMAQKSALFYLQKLLVPTGLTAIYPFQGTLTILSPEFYLPMLVHIALVTIAVWQWRKRPMIAYGIFFYYLTLVPTFFNFHKGDLMFFAVDRYAYIPSIGFLLVLVLVVGSVVRVTHLPRQAGAAIVAFVLAALITMSVKQTAFWDSPDTLFGHTLALYPESVSARMAMGSVLRERNQLEDAFKILHEGAQYSDHPGLNVEAGLVYSAAGQVQDARDQFKFALKKNPTLPPPMYYLGFLDEYEKNDAGAITWYQKAIAADPSYVTARVHLAELLMKQKKLDEAEAQLKAAYAWNPVSDEVVSAYIDLETQRGNTAEVQRWIDWKTSMGIGPEPF